MLPFLIPLIAAGVQTLAEKSSADKQQEFQEKEAAEAVAARRKQAITNALGARDLHVAQPLKAPDLSSERMLGAIGSLVGAASAAKLGGGQQTTAAGSTPQGQFADPSEVIRRRLQNSYDPFGDQYGIG